MEQHTVLIISENKADHLILAECLARAKPARFQLAASEAMERPLEALLDPMIDAVIMGHGAQTEYLLRLANKNNAAAPLIMMLDESEQASFGHLRELGAQDYLIRGQLQDALVHRVLDYGIQLRKARENPALVQSRHAYRGAQPGGFSCSFGACDGPL